MIRPWKFVHSWMLRRYVYSEISLCDEIERQKRSSSVREKYQNGKKKEYKSFCSSCSSSNDIDASFFCSFPTKISPRLSLERCVRAARRTANGVLNISWAAEECELHDRAEEDGGIRRWWNAAGREIDGEKRREQRETERERGREEKGGKDAVRYVGCGW